MRGRKILIIDDEKGFADIVKLNLEGTGEYRVMGETKGARGLSTANRFITAIGSRPISTTVQLLLTAMPDNVSGA